MSALAGCSASDVVNPTDESEPVTPRPTVSAPADTSTTVTATPGPIQPGPNTSAQNWLYNGEFPGSELRVKEGDVLETTVKNDVSEGTTVHWHGIPVPNAMDGVPDVTQQPIAPGGTFTYKFRAKPAGTYFYHSHVGLQLDRGLLPPLVIEEQNPHVEYDREYTVVVDDYLDQEPRPLSEVDSGQGPMGGGRGGRGGRGGMGGGDPSGMGNTGQMGDRRPPYAGLLINGRLPTHPQTFTVQEGERVRLRFVNAGSATAFRVRTAGHKMNITHADGRPVEPVTVDSFIFGAGERYDAVVEADNPGTWELRADAINGGETPARAVLQYEGNSGSESPTTPSSKGRQLQYGDLRAVSSLDGIDGRPDRQFDLTLSASRGGSYEWLIGGQAYPDADPLNIREGDHVRVQMVNRSPVIHPMHLHGHFFQVQDAVKDTVIVPGHMGEVTFDFVADNPGSWLFHCHNLYHLEAGMARVIQYVE